MRTNITRPSNCLDHSSARSVDIMFNSVDRGQFEILTSAGSVEITAAC